MTAFEPEDVGPAVRWFADMLTAGLDGDASELRRLMDDVPAAPGYALAYATRALIEGMSAALGDEQAHRALRASLSGIDEDAVVDTAESILQKEHPDGD